MGERMEKVGRSLKALQEIIRKEARSGEYLSPAFHAICQVYSPRQS